MELKSEHFFSEPYGKNIPPGEEDFCHTEQFKLTSS